MPATLTDPADKTTEPAVLTPEQKANRERTWEQFLRLAPEWHKRPAS